MTDIIDTQMNDRDSDNLRQYVVTVMDLENILIYILFSSEYEPWRIRGWYLFRREGEKCGSEIEPVLSGRAQHIRIAMPIGKNHYSGSGTLIWILYLQ